MSEIRQMMKEEEETVLILCCATFSRSIENRPSLKCRVKVNQTSTYEIFLSYFCFFSRCIIFLIIFTWIFIPLKSCRLFYFLPHPFRYFWVFVCIFILPFLVVPWSFGPSIYHFFSFWKLLFCFVVLWDDYIILIDAWAREPRHIEGPGLFRAHHGCHARERIDDELNGARARRRPVAGTREYKKSWKTHSCCVLFAM